MLNLFVLPISGIMKMWHLFFHSLLGIEEHHAWLLSLVGLIIAVRTLIAPFAWMQFRAARISVLMRPHLDAVRRAYAERTDRRGMLEEMALTSKLRKRFQYKPAAGCIPPIIQLIAFLGLYRLLLRIARPTEGIEGEHHRIGFLSAHDVDSFLHSTFLGVPLPAYRAMSPEQLENLGTTRAEITGMILPFLVLAVVFTVLNTALSLHRTRQSLDYASGFALNIYKITLILAIVVPFMLVSAGLFGPLPVAIILYWFGNNLWTLLQNALIHLALRSRLPLDKEHRAYFQRQREEHQGIRQREREERREIRALRLKGLGSAEHRQLATKKSRLRKVQRVAEKKHRKDIAQAKKQTRRGIIAEAKAAKKGQAGAPAVPAATDAQTPTVGKHSLDREWAGRMRIEVPEERRGQGGRHRREE
ncbi:membrane protein insertase YidC [Corynebacterium sp. 22KM0430]|uniref:membrane protein insertase YidC n=1 Tax=Corynebacterium sp. 22KM0430 TaxID=2989735 RepID=UPI0029CA76CA|nr:membrane protein insertase YidC [Corynebacterium sp. 22KM0430]WPF66076.1 membrane protein insertase YidC [Corynebacterium sp. 22KM0430]